MSGVEKKQKPQLKRATSGATKIFGKRRLDIPYDIPVVKEGGFAEIFDSQTENFQSPKGQSTKPSETEFCWLSTE